MLETLAVSDRLLLEKIAQSDDVNIAQMFEEDKSTTGTLPLKSPTTDKEKRKAERIEAEDQYITEIDTFLRAGNLVARLQAKYEALQKALGEGMHEQPTVYKPPSLPPKPKKISKNSADYPKLFGGTIEEYVEKTGQPIPQIILSCVRLVNLYGMHHQGIFRISGSQADINAYKVQFEQGVDPLDGKLDGDDINTVAGLLKLYFRELKEPLFPRAIFDKLIECCQKYSVNDLSQVLEWKAELRSILSTIPQTVCIVMRYLFAFLSHVSEYSDENMMDASNLAICFGPTLLPIPDGRDQVQYQTFVNELIKNMIIHYESVLPFDGGVVYERCVVEDDGDKDYTDAMSDDDMLSTSGAIYEEDEDEEQTAVAQFDFTGRTKRELSFKKGDIITLHLRKSVDWWEGTVGDSRGLVPDKYIKLKGGQKSDDSLRKSTESLAVPTATSSAGDSKLVLGSLQRASSQPNIAALVAQSEPSCAGTTATLPQPTEPRGISRRSVSPHHHAEEQVGGANDFGAIDSTLAKVMSSIKTLDERQKDQGQSGTTPTSAVTAVDTSMLSDQADLSKCQHVTGDTKLSANKLSAEKADVSKTATANTTTATTSSKVTALTVDSNKNITDQFMTVPIFVKPPSPHETQPDTTMTSSFSNFTRSKTKAATLPKTASEAEAFKLLEGSKFLTGLKSSSSGSGCTIADAVAEMAPEKEQKLPATKSVLTRSDSSPQHKDRNSGHGGRSVGGVTLLQSTAEPLPLQSRAIPASVPIVPHAPSATNNTAPVPPPKPLVGKKPPAIGGMSSPKPGHSTDELKLATPVAKK
jgi:hypothetical protein